MKSPALLVEEALDSAHVARDLLNVATVPPKKSRLLPLLGVFGASVSLTPKRPPRDVVRRTSNALDIFAKDFAAAAQALGDVELIELSKTAASWGTQLWDEEVTGQDLQPQMSQAEGDLIRHKMALFRQRSTGD